MNTSDNWTIIDEKLVQFSLDTVQITCHCICIVLGTLINVFVGSILICNRRLHTARHIIYLGVVFSNLLTLLMALMELLAVCLSNQTACVIYSVIIGKPYVLVLLNFLLGACDRYLYVTNPLKHKMYITVFRVVIIQLVSSSVLLVLLMTSYWTFGNGIRCGLDLEANQGTPIVMMVLTILCFIVKSLVYHLTKKCIATQMTDGVTTKMIPLTKLPKRIDRTAHLNCETNKEASPECSSKATTFFVHCNRQRFSRMELEATTAFVAGLIPLCLFTLPIYLWTFWEWLCKNVFQGWDTLNYMYAYSRELLLIHVCTNLLVLVFLSKEFKSTVKDNLVQIKHRFHIRTRFELAS